MSFCTPVCPAAISSSAVIRSIAEPGQLGGTRHFSAAQFALDHPDRTQKITTTNGFFGAAFLACISFVVIQGETSGYTAPWIVALFVAYPLSSFPACVIGAWLCKWGALSSRSVETCIETTYAPVFWVTDRVPPLRHAGESIWRIIGERLSPL